MTKTKKSEPCYILVIENNVHHAELITEILDKNFAPVVIHTVDTIEDAFEFVTQSNYDLIISAGVVRDVPLSESIPKLLKLTNDCPIIIISGRSDEKLAAELIKKGAAEYLSKTRETLDNLPQVIRRHLKFRHARKEKKQHLEGTNNKLPSPATIVKELDRITQQALALASPRRSKRRFHSPDIEQLDVLLNQIQSLKQLATRLTPKNK